jgi:DNA repair protein SbcD/Mre11
MRLVHLSDLHLGFRQYDKTDARGINLREKDVAQSFSRAIDTIIALAPELVVIGGDIYHYVKPSPFAVVHATNQFARLRESLPHVEIVCVAGNHDSPRGSDTGSFLPLFRQAGVHVVDGAPQWFDFPHLDCSVLGVADNKYPRPELAPKGNRRFNVMVLHGETGGISPKGSEAAKRELSPGELHVNAWDYIALGHYHVYRECAPNLYYSGAIEYSSSNIWGERAEEVEGGIVGKGIVERDLATREQTFHPLPARRVLDLPSFSAAEMSPVELNDAIRSTVEAVEGGIDGAIVRLVVRDLSVESGRLVDSKMLGAFRRAALAFTLDARRPEKAANVGVMERARKLSLDGIVAERLMLRMLPSDVDRTELVALAGKYMTDAAEKGTGIAAAAPEVAA